MIHIINSLGMGGAENFLKDVVKPGDIVITLLNQNSEVEPSCTVLNLNIVRSPFASIRKIRETVRARDRFAEPVVGWLYLGMFATVFLADLSASVCWTVRTSNLGRRSKIHSWLLVYLLGLLSWFFPASIIYCSKQALIWHRKYAFWKNGVVVLNGVRPGVGGKRPQYRVLLPRNPVKVAVIARLDDQKGQRWLLGNLEEISTKNYEVVFYGRGVSSLVPEYGHLANVGLYEGRDSYSILPGCDVLLMPSLYGEGYPNIVAEALCTGVYVIAAETGSVDEFNLADDQMFPPGDFRALSRCLDGFRRMDLDLIDRRVQYQSNHISSQHVRSLQIQLFRKYASQK